MKLLLILLLILIVAGSLLADYKWKQWVARQQAARDRERRDGDPF